MGQICFASAAELTGLSRDIFIIFSGYAGDRVLIPFRRGYPRGERFGREIGAGVKKVKVVSSTSPCVFG